jgi:parvulin-like peptidyl-prolyl isomerase
MNSSFKISLLISALLLCNNILAQEVHQVLARTGTDVISLQDYTDRYEFMPHLNYSDDNPDTLKKEFLYSLIAEKLWYLEALNEGLDTLINIRYSLQTLRKLFLKDELYKREVESKIFISPDEIAKGVKFLPRVLDINIITADDSITIFSLYESLIYKNASFDSLVQIYGPDELKISPMKISFGKMSNEYIEEIIFSLNPGEISSPVFVNGKWIIFKLISETLNDNFNKSSEHKKNAVYTLIKERKGKILSGKFLDKIIGGKSIAADKEIFLSFSNKIYNTIIQRLQTQKESGAEFQLTEVDLITALKDMDADELSLPFIKFEENPLTLYDFVYYLIYQKIYFNSADKKSIRSVLNSYVKQFIEDELLVREAVKTGLENLPSFKKDLDIWREYYLSEILMQKFTRDIRITQSDIAAFREESGKQGSEVMQVNIIEILTDNLEVIGIILDQVNEGAEFRDLAKIYNQREWTKRSNGEWGFFTIAAGGEIGKIAAGMETGEIYGPVKVPEGYSIFKLINKRFIKSGQRDTIETGIINTQLA